MIVIFFDSLFFSCFCYSLSFIYDIYAPSNNECRTLSSLIVKEENRDGKTICYMKCERRVRENQQDKILIPLLEIHHQHWVLSAIFHRFKCQFMLSYVISMRKTITLFSFHYYDFFFVTGLPLLRHNHHQHWTEHISSTQ